MILSFLARAYKMFAFAIDQPDTSLAFPARCSVVISVSGANEVNGCFASPFHLQRKTDRGALNTANTVSTCTQSYLTLVAQLLLPEKGLDRG